MPTAEKSAVIEQLQETFDGAAAIFLADFTGLDVAQITQLRRKCRENGVDFRVIKNTLAVKAVRKLELNDLEPHLKGPTALAVSTDDPTSPARVLVEFQKDHDMKPALKLGFIDGKILSAEEVHRLATLPTRDELISQVMQLSLAPAQNFVGVLNAVMSQVVRTVDAVRDGMENGTIQAAPAAAPEPASEPVADQEAEAPEAEEPEETPADGGEEAAADENEEKPE
jgi:large subunit ribosomal protein L10